MITPWTIRPSTRAVSLIASRAKLDIVGVEKDHLSPCFADCSLERNPRAGRGLGKNHRPGLAGEGLQFMMAAFLLHGAGGGQDVFHVRQPQLLNAQQIVHDDNPATTDSMICKPSSASALLQIQRRQKPDGRGYRGNRQQTRDVRTSG